MAKTSFWGGYLIRKENIVILSKCLSDVQTKGLKDYKFMCFNGRVQCVFVCTERYSATGLRVTFFDREWKWLPFIRHYPASEQQIPKPECFDKTIILAEKLARGIPFVRVDFYEIMSHIYFGELTLYPGCGFEEFSQKLGL